MAEFTVTVQLDSGGGHEPGDRLRVYLGSGDRLTLAQSTPTGGSLVYDEPIGPPADAPGSDPAPTRTLELTVRAPLPERVAILAVGISVVDAIGNETTLHEGFERFAEAPSGVTTRAIEATENNNEATLSWTTSPQVEGALS